MYILSNPYSAASFQRQCRGGMQSLMLRRSLASAPDSSSQPDLVVEYLEEENKGIVVLGMNRPKVNNYIVLGVKCLV